MKVKEAKDIITTMELSTKSLDKAAKLLAGLADSDELSEQILDELLALIDKESVDNDEVVSDEEVLAYVDKAHPVVKK